MAAKGTLAKEALLARFKDAAGADYAGADEGAKKYYFWSTENGERVQVCISMTVPKTPFMAAGAPAVESNEIIFEDSVSTAAPKTMMDADEKATLDRLLKELNL